MAYMSPLYIHLEDVESRLARKYSLHLYREAGWDLDLTGGVNRSAAWLLMRTHNLARCKACLCCSFLVMLDPTNK